LRISARLRLPNYAKNESKLDDLSKQLGLQIREYDQAESLYDLSNKATIGQTEFDLVNSTCQSIRRVLDEELKLDESK
jgi:hypothetical protein